MLRIKSLPSADRSDLCNSHTVTRPNPGRIENQTVGQTPPAVVACSYAGLDGI